MRSRGQMRRTHEVLAGAVVAGASHWEQRVPARADRLRIATISYGLPVPGLKRGGIERVADMLADGLARRGHDVTVFTHDPKPAGAAYDVRTLPWKGFVDTWLGRRVTMGYLGNVLAVVPNYSQFDVIVAHGDSLLLPLARKPLVRVMHGSALGEARSAAQSAASSCRWVSTVRSC